MSIGADSPPEDLIATEAAEFQPEVSPDGHWMAYASTESGRFEVYVRPFPDVDDGKWQISRDGGLCASLGTRRARVVLSDDRWCGDAGCCRGHGAGL